jgi:hypothetical protein
MKRNSIRRVLKSAVYSLPGVTREGVFDLVKRVSKGVVASLPNVAKEAVFEQICDDFGRFAAPMIRSSLNRLLFIGSAPLMFSPETGQRFL